MLNNVAAYAMQIRVLVALVVVGSAAATDVQAQPQPQVATDGDTICDEAGQHGLDEVSGNARYLLRRDGSLEVSDDASNPLSFRVVGPISSDTMWARLELVGLRSRLVACRRVAPGRTYQLAADAGAVDSRDILRISLYDRAVGDELDRLSEIRIADEAAHPRLALWEFEAAAYLANLRDQYHNDLRRHFTEWQASGFTAEERVAVEEGLQDMEEYLRLQVRDDCPHAPFGTTQVCLLAVDTLRKVQRIQLVLSIARDADGDGSRVSERNHIYGEALELGRQLQDMLSLATTPSRSQLEAHCLSVGRVFALKNFGELRTMAVFELSAHPSQQTVLLQYGAGSQRLEQDLSTGDVTIIVAGAPTRSPVAFSHVEGDEIYPELSMAEGLARLVGTLGHFLAGGPLQTTACPAGIDRVVDPAVSPIASMSTRARRLSDLNARHEQVVRVCSGATCTTEGATANVQNRLRIRPLEPNGWSLLMETAFNISRSHLDSGRFEPVGRAGPDQLFEFDHDYEFRRSITVSLLLGWRFRLGCVGFFAGMGPSLLIGTKGSALRQWNFRIGVDVGSGVFVTAGAGFRYVGRPLQYSDGDLVSVPLVNGTATAPAIATNQRPVAVFGIGLSINLSLLSDAGKGLISAMGGGS